MKRFFPSSVMLIPFVVKHYSEPDSDEQPTSEEQQDTIKEVEPEPIS
tara:strand:+ start:1923 stop:2063 length:141 start_codon:yes stop_codon:yes gene_type:complete